MRKLYTPDELALLQDMLAWLWKSLVSTHSLEASHKNTWKPGDDAECLAGLFRFSSNPRRVSPLRRLQTPSSVSFALSSPLHPPFPAQCWEELQPSVSSTPNPVHQQKTSVKLNDNFLQKWCLNTHFQCIIMAREPLHAWGKDVGEMEFPGMPPPRTITVETGTSQ